MKILYNYETKGRGQEYYHWLIQWRKMNKRKYKQRLIANRNKVRKCFGVQKVADVDKRYLRGK